MKRLTVDQFHKRYQDDDACLERLFQIRFQNLVCPKCENDKPFTRVKNRRSYQCPCCGFQVYPTKGTIFEKTTTPLTYWFSAIYLQTTTRNGVAAKELERQLNICYKTALRMAHQIKILMSDKDCDRLTGLVEVDETYIGGKMKNKHKEIRLENAKNPVSSIDNKVGVMGFIQRGVNVKLEVMHYNESFKDRVRSNVAPDATLITDSHNSYNGLDKEYKAHEVLNHIEEEYKRGIYHTNTIEGFWSIVKRTINGTHIHVSARHLQKYVDEIAFRYRYKDNQDIMFETILERIVS